MIDPLTPEEIKKYALAFMKENKTLVLSTASSDGRPQAATLYYIVDNDFTLHCATHRESQKVRNIEQNKQVVFTIGFGPSPITIQGAGEAELLTDGVSLKLVGRIGFDLLDQMPLFRAGTGGGFVAIKIKPTEIKWLNLDSKGHPETYSDTYHSVFP